jgi:hypothetical protein
LGLEGTVPGFCNHCGEILFRGFVADRTVRLPVLLLPVRSGSLPGILLTAQ